MNSPRDSGRIERMSLIEQGPSRHVRMANLAIVGSHSVNGVARIHSDLLRTRVVTDFADMFPQRFNNKTNGAATHVLLCRQSGAGLSAGKLIIKLINNIADTIDADPSLRGRMKVVFLPTYNVSLAERLIPASDVSEQISTAGYEASGTGNMKFMMNGALTIGTRDGATIEMAEEAGEENFFLFGLTAQQVADSRGWYSPWWHYENDPEIRQALDLIFNDHFSANERGIFAPLRQTLLESGDYYMHLADLKSYADAQARLGASFASTDDWFRKVVLNVASSGRFSSDRTIAEYASEIWNAEPCPVLAGKGQVRADDRAGDHCGNCQHAGDASQVAKYKSQKAKWR